MKEMTISPEQSNNSRTSCGCSHPSDESERPGVTSVQSIAATESDLLTSRYRIEKMDCPTEERLIRNRLENMNGVVRLDFNLIDRKLTVLHRAEAAEIEKALVALDMSPVAISGAEPASKDIPALTQRQKLLLALSGIAAIGAEGVAWATGQEASPLVMTLAAISIVAAGLPTLKKGWIAVKNWTLNIYFLMSLAVAGAVVIGKWPEASMVVFLFALAETIEALSLERARNAIRSLTDLAPETAEVKEKNEWQQRSPGEIAIGSTIRIRPGNRVPLDALVSAGAATLNQAPITGESLPIEKKEGDPLFAGSIVVDGVVEATVTATANQSTIARIAAAIQDAQSQRAPTQRFVDQFAKYYTPAVVILALLVAIVGPLWTDGSLTSWLYQALVILVIACPCALVVSTPVTVVSGLASAARKGILIKGGAFLEDARKLRTVALDKTGTLTRGQPSLTDIIPLTELSASDALHVAASLDEHSTHPVAKAIVSDWRNKAANVSLLSVENFRVLPGRGVQGTIDAREWVLGNHRLVEELGVCSPTLERHLSALEGQGKTAIVLISISGPVAVLAVADTVRPESAEAVAKLIAQNVTAVMLTGDNQTTASVIASQIGISDARGNLLPEDKQSIVGELKSLCGSVAMVGDGVNDAPALARADIGIAMGAAGTATAMETADIAIMDDDPRKISQLIDLSRSTARILTQNISLALGLKAVFLVLALLGKATLWMAVFADMGASLLVVFNGLRLLRK